MRERSNPFIVELKEMLSDPKRIVPVMVADYFPWLVKGIDNAATIDDQKNIVNEWRSYIVNVWRSEGPILQEEFFELINFTSSIMACLTISKNEVMDLLTSYYKRNLSNFSKQ